MNRKGKLNRNSDKQLSNKNERVGALTLNDKGKKILLWNRERERE